MYKASSLPTHSWANEGAADHRFSRLFGHLILSEKDSSFLRARLCRMYHKSFRYLALLCRREFGPTPSGHTNGIPVRVILAREDANPRETCVEVKSGSTEVVKGPPPLPPLAEMPFFRETRVPGEEPEWAAFASKEAFAEYFFGGKVPFPPYEDEQWYTPLALPREGIVTILLSGEELERIYNLVGDSTSHTHPHMEIVSPLFMVELEGTFGHLYTPGRLHICGHPHEGCNRAETRYSYFTKNPFIEWELMLRNQRDHYLYRHNVTPSQFLTVKLPEVRTGNYPTP